MTAFPTFSNGKLPDQATWEEEHEDPSQSSKIEGGYVSSRPSFTRRPRKSFRFGYKNVSNTDKVAFEAFWDAQFGGSTGFTWNHPFNGQSYTVRFVQATNGKPPIYKYAHYHQDPGGAVDHRWDITQIELQEV